jgi:hypothetical protein
MAKSLYCWRCRMDIPMLDESEWAQVGALLENPVQTIKTYRQEHQVSLNEARKEAFWEVLALYRELTGFPESNVDALWHHRISLYGPPCRECGKPLRTPVARRCVECGTERATAAEQ